VSCGEAICWKGGDRFANSFIDGGQTDTGKMAAIKQRGDDAGSAIDVRNVARVGDTDGAKV